jgi:hypothetical protein
MVCGWEHVGGRLHVKGVSVEEISIHHLIISILILILTLSLSVTFPSTRPEIPPHRPQPHTHLLRFTLLDSYSMPWGCWMVLVGGLQEDRTFPSTRPEIPPHRPQPHTHRHPFHVQERSLMGVRHTHR